jgi:hypothetical protein
MSDASQLRNLSDFEWASATQYISYISSVAGLAEINSNHVISFPLARIGPDKLLKQKRRVLILLEGNKKSIERLVGERKSDLDENELAILRSLYVQYKANIETVEAHISFILECIVEVELSLLKSREIEDDDYPF